MNKYRLGNQAKSTGSSARGPDIHLEIPAQLDRIEVSAGLSAAVRLHSPSRPVIIGIS